MLLPVLCLLLASFCQWFTGPVRSEPGALGMVAPVPVSWEAVQPTGHLAPTSFWDADSDRLGSWQRFASNPGLLLQIGQPFGSFGRQERLLWWGRLLLEGG